MVCDDCNEVYLEEGRKFERRLHRDYHKVIRVLQHAFSMKIGIVTHGGIIRKYTFVTLSLFSLYIFVLGMSTQNEALVSTVYDQTDSDSHQRLRSLVQFNNVDNSWKGYFKRTIQGLTSNLRAQKSDETKLANTKDSPSSMDGEEYEDERPRWNFTGPYNPHPFNFLKNPKDACKSRRIFLLNVIHTKPSHFNRRNIIRETWADKNVGARIDALTIFFMGLTNDTRTEAALREESDRYRDIVQEDFLDSYKNLTYKAVSILRWVTNFCPDAEFVLKTDDDVFVNTFDIIRLIRRRHLIEPNHNKIMCRMAIGKVHREPSSAWYMSEKDYPHEHYPPFCKGAAFIMPGPVVPRLYQASLITKFFWVDDVYSTGMLAHVANVSHLNLVNKFIYWSNDPRKDLLLSEGAATHVAGGASANVAEQQWKDILKVEQNAR